jgi:hypothetical protein
LWPRDLILSVRELGIPQTATQILQSQSSSASTGQNMLSSHAQTLATSRSADVPNLSVLQLNTFAFVKVEEEFLEDTNHHVCVVQLPATSDAGLDTTHSAASIPVRWWRPLQANLDTKWVVWFNESGTQQERTPVIRTAIYACNLELHGRSNTTGALKGRWLKLNNSSRQIEADFQEDENSEVETC